MEQRKAGASHPATQPVTGAPVTTNFGWIIIKSQVKTGLRGKSEPDSLRSFQLREKTDRMKDNSGFWKMAWIK